MAARKPPRPGPEGAIRVLLAAVIVLAAVTACTPATCHAIQRPAGPAAGTTPPPTCAASTP